MPARAVPCLLGPTASGKSEVAVEAARRTQGAVIQCDAFSVYEGMEILTAAPRGPHAVPHHLVAERDPADAWSAATFVERCDDLVSTIHARGGTPWVVGGTALYLRQWLKGFGAPVARDEAYRAMLRARAAAEGKPALHEALRQVDTERAAALHPNDLRRVIRALEIVHVTGQAASDQRSEWSGPDRHPAHLFGLRWAREELDARIARRTDAMFEAGVVDEARALLARPLSPEAGKVIGLDILGALLEGQIDEAEARRSLAGRTRRLARKQMTFFRSFEGVHWIDVQPSDEPADIAARILEAGQLETSS